MCLSDAASPPVSDVPPPGRTLAILVADDSRIDRRIASSILEGRGHRVAAAADGIEALALFRGNEEAGTPFDAAVIDFQMPGLGGEDLALALREARSDGSPPFRVVLLSGAADEQASWRGIDAALTKPLDPTALIAALESLSTKKDANKEAVPPTERPELDRVVFDLGEALARARGKRGLLIELVKIFMEDSEKYLVALRQAVADGNLEQAEKAAHRLKGSSANVSAQLAADAAEKIEKTLRATQALPHAILFETLSDEMAKARKALTGFLAQNRGS